MKKTFKLTHEKLKVDRHVDAIRHEIRKYIKRERRRQLPEGADYWDFDCRFGAEEASSEVIHVGAIDESINLALSEKLNSFYLEIIAIPANRESKSEATE